MAGSEMVRWELIALHRTGPYRLTMQYATGSIVEYFDDPTEALLRETELEALLIASRTSGYSSSGAGWVVTNQPAALVRRAS